MDATALALSVKKRAAALGFDAVGIAEARGVGRDAAALREWLRAGMHASMHWMARGVDPREDPSRLLPGCRSVVSVAMNYWPGAEATETAAGGAKLALYARGRDYHKVLGRKLRELASWIEEASGHSARSFVDTGPVLERAWAQASGLGWIGKNANLLTRSMGSWVLLGEILTVAALDADGGPHEDFCGTCTACIQACPTSAIVAPGVVDSRRCISYWTIEHRGPIPEPLQRGMGDWIFGCDDCQSVCPWNRRFARAVPAERFSMREDLRGVDPREMLEIEEPAFRRRFSGTALMRAGWEGMRRNARAVLANRRR